MPAGQHGKTDARAAGASNSHLEHLFKKKMNVSVMGYLQDLRIQKAKVLLVESAHNVTEIARLCGYSSIHHFSRRFKKVARLSPSQYAKMVHQAPHDYSSDSQKQSKAG